MYGSVGGALLVGAAALPQLGEGGTGRRHLGDLELEQVDVAGGADRHVQTPVVGGAGADEQLLIDQIGWTRNQ